MSKRFFSYLTLLLCYLSAANAVTLPLYKDSSVVGDISYAYARHGETLIDVGRRLDIGSLQIEEANPSLPKKQPLSIGTKVTIPSQFVLPNVNKVGIVINLAEQRLYFFPENKDIVMTEPVGIGRTGQWKTPTGITKVTKKVVDPYWHPTAAVRTEAAKNGTPIPWQFPPGGINPLGRHILRLGWASYLIHSTNQPESVGGLVSAGCIRMLPKGIENIFEDVEVGMPVTVINESVKVGWRSNKIYIESHKPLYYGNAKSKLQMSSIVEMINNELDGLSILRIVWPLIEKSVVDNSGIPQIIGNIG